MSHTEKILSLIYFYFLLPVFTLYAYIVKNPKTQKYFESNGLLYLGDISSGYATDFLNGIGTTEIWTKLYNRVKQEKADFAGGDFIGHNFIIARKPSFIKSVLVKDASNFDRVHSLLSLKGDYIVSKSMVFMQGEDWKKTRAKFESAFTPSKVKRSFDQANQLGKNLVAYLNRELDNDSEKGIDFRIAAHKFSLDSAGSSTLSLDTASLQTREPSRFEQISAKFFLSFDNFTNWWKPGLIQLFPRIATYFKITVIDKEIVQFYGHIAKENMKNSGGDKNSNDFGGLVHSTWQELYWGHVDRPDQEEWITANLFGMLLPGYKTTQTLMAMGAYVLAIHQDVQDKLRDEISAMIESNGEEFNFAAVNGMTYIDMVINETLRMYSPVGLLARTCKKEYAVPDTTLVLKAGDIIVIPLYGLHYDEEYHPNPEVFDPERFSGANKDFTFLPFSQGPRNCIDGIYFLCAIFLARWCHQEESEWPWCKQK
ncbi:cytochrome P450 9e2 isoform X2 [Folsomia candida]|uniref:cytochrome P450 9e2 isoform X2 n=1 Tax=Folsomia candida TaxID=158441 RepID=UPI000B8F12DB|nr:cytochrome P450 9e2 isoform X2 [Folsomia candida]